MRGSDQMGVFQIEKIGRETSWSIWVFAYTHAVSDTERRERKREKDSVSVSSLVFSLSSLSHSLSFSFQSVLIFDLSFHASLWDFSYWSLSLLVCLYTRQTLQKLTKIISLNFHFIVIIIFLKIKEKSYIYNFF